MPSAADQRAADGRRRPRQARGQRRVDAILDAAAALLVERGPAGVTMQAVASRSATASGSLYHFFPDRECVLRALAERHARALRELALAIRARLADDAREEGAARAGSRQRVETLVDCFVEPVLEYVRAHPDFLVIAGTTAPVDRTAPGDVDLDAATQAAAEHLAGACDPAASPEERDARAAAVSAAMEGTMARLARAEDARSAAALVRELKRLLVAYLHRPTAAPSARGR